MVTISIIESIKSSSRDSNSRLLSFDGIYPTVHLTILSTPILMLHLPHFLPQ